MNIFKEIDLKVYDFLDLKNRCISFFNSRIDLLINLEWGRTKMCMYLF
jgi:hypothetical protein